MSKIRSIRESRARIGVLEALIKSEQQALANELVAAIPSGMRQWFMERGGVMIDNGRLVPSGPFTHWLDGLREQTIRRGVLYTKIFHTDLPEYGIKDFADMQVKFAELEAAWNGLIKVRLHDGGPASSISIYWAMAEYHDPKDIPIEFQ